MRESRRTMARRNPDSPAPSTTLQFQAEDFGSFGAEPRRTVTIAEASAFASPAQTADGGPSDGDKSGAAARALQTSEPTLANETVTSPSRRDATSKRRKAKHAPASPRGPDFSIEAARLALNARHVAGVDEAGRGPLAGPVVAAAVILDMAALPVGLDDSKKLTAAIRERLFEEIVRSAVVSVASASAVEIDRWNIRQATLLAMTRALAGLERMPCHAIVDGRDVPVAWTSRGTAVIEGDARSLSIAAASIIAKVTRDRMMQRLCAAYPAYGFSRHMGYATAEHRLALDRHGPCPFHRMTFSPIRQGSLDLG